METALLQDIIKNNPIAMQLAEARKQSLRLNMHITGKNWQDAIELMDEFETEQKKNLRQKYSRSNKDIFTRLHRNIDKIFSAKGGSVVVNLPDAMLRQWNAYSTNIRNGMPLLRWIHHIALPAYQIDPNGLIFIEIDLNGNPYPTYKSTNDIFYYKINGRKTEFVIFKLTQDEVKKYFGNYISSNSLQLPQPTIDKNTVYYRVVDNVSDSIYAYEGGELKEITELSIPNYFKVCPGILVSDLFEFNSNLLLSPDDDVVELANSILTDNSTFEIWKKLHMFPKHWRVASVCPSCMGSGTQSGVECKDCNGTGKQKRSSVRDEIIVNPPSGDGIGSFPTQFDGYSTPPVEAWELSTQDLDRLYDQMYETLWGCQPKNKAHVKVSQKEKTATQVLDESQDVASRLRHYSRWAENIMVFITDMCCSLMFKDAYKGCSIKLGDRYILESPDVLFEKYRNGLSQVNSQATLNNLLKDYYESLYENNPIQLQIALKKMKVEPFVHSSITDVKAMLITEDDKLAKGYFSEWDKTINDMSWVTSSEDSLRTDLYAFAAAKKEIVITDMKEQATYMPESISQRIN